MYHILGAGISGLSASYHLNLKGIDSQVYEKRERWGGLCDNFEIEGFRFDYCVHFTFTHDDYVRKIFEKRNNYYIHKPLSYNYYNRKWIKHPIQNNLYNLDTEEKIKIIRDFVKRQGSQNLRSYEDWLKTQYGNYFSINYPMKYSRKYWSTEAKKLSTDWIGNRMYKPTIDEVLFGAFNTETQNAYYTKEMRYPQNGGYKSVLDYFVNKSNINLNKEVKEIDIDNKKLIFQDGKIEYYENLISSLPLPEIIKIIKDVPIKVKNAAEKLVATQVDLVSLGFNRPDVAKYLWFYIYDEDILPARAYSPNLKSPDNVPKGFSSLQFETYSSKYKSLNVSGDNLIEHVVEKGQKMGVFTKNDIKFTDYRKVKYGNVIFDHDIKKNRKIVHNYLDSVGIKYIGRFGEWMYLWSDQSFLSGKKIANKIKDI